VPSVGWLVGYIDFLPQETRPDLVKDAGRQRGERGCLEYQKKK